jgi:glycosyltransferase involved in cell wall biosynthesis
MKILFVLEYYYPHVGGIEKLFKDLAEALVKEHHEVLVITNKYKNQLPKNEIINGVHIKRLNLKNRFLFTFLSLPAILKYARKFDFIHTTSYNAALPASLAGFFLKKKVIITFHEVWGNLWFKLPFINRIQKTLFYLYEKLVLKLPYHTFIAVSDATKDSLIKYGVSSNQIIRIYNGVDYEIEPQIKALNKDQFIFTFMGRLGISKGLDLLIPAAKKFIEEKPDAIFQLITPDTPTALHQKISKLISDENLESHIIWHKNIETKFLKDKLQISNCVIIPSYSEGFCFVAAEVISMGIPIISSDQYALKEVVSGKFIKMKALSSEAIYQSLCLAKENKFETNEIKKFHLQESLRAYLNFYNSIDFS